MPRTRKGAARRQSKVRWFKLAKGYRGSRRKSWRKIKETVYRAGAYAYRDRRQIKRVYRRLWITRISAATRMRGISYSRFSAALKLANITLNRKMLSQLAIDDPQGFDKVIELTAAHTHRN